MVDSSDKRDFRRMNVEIRAIFKVNGDQNMQEGIVTDLSATGLKILTDTRVVIGDEIDVKVKPAKTVVPPLYARVKVLRIDVNEESPKYHLGCEITEMLT